MFEKIAGYCFKDQGTCDDMEFLYDCDDDWEQDDWELGDLDND